MDELNIYDIRLKSICNCLNSINLVIRELSLFILENKIFLDEDNFLDLQNIIYYLSDSIHNVGYPLYNIDNDDFIIRFRDDLFCLLNRLDYYKSRTIFENARYRFLLLRVIGDVLEDIDDLDMSLGKIKKI